MSKANAKQTSAAVRWGRTIWYITAFFLSETVHLINHVVAVLLGVLRAISPSFLGSRVVKVRGGFVVGYKCLGLFREGRSGKSVVKFEGVPFAGVKTRFAAPHEFSEKELSERSGSAKIGNKQIINPNRISREGYNLGSAACMDAQPALPLILDSPIFFHVCSHTVAKIGRGGVVGTETESLQLNVWTPDEALSSSSASLPVYVFIHGGGFMFGSSHSKYHSGEAFCRAHRCVVVTLNYRLGFMGFLRVPGMPANRGILDQLAGLKWIKQNIRVFGGDPGNITVGGQSAGAMSVSALLGTEAVYRDESLHKGILYSGGSNHFFSKNQAIDIFGKVRDLLDCSDDAEAVAKLSKMPLADFFKVQIRFMAARRQGFGDAEVGQLCALYPWVEEGTVLPQHPLTVMRNRRAKGEFVPAILAGSTDEEFTMWTRKALGGKLKSPADDDMDKVLGSWLSKLLSKPSNAPKVEALVHDIVGAYAPGVEASPARTSRLTKPNEKGNALATDYIFRIPVEVTAAASPAGFVFRFDRRSPISNVGATHTLDLLYWMENLSCFPYFAGPAARYPFVGKDAGDDRGLSSLMSDLLYAFVALPPSSWKSTPLKSFTSGAVTWPAFDGMETRNVAIFGRRNQTYSKMEVESSPDAAVTKPWIPVIEEHINLLNAESKL